MRGPSQTDHSQREKKGQKERGVQCINEIISVTQGSQWGHEEWSDVGTDAGSCRWQGRRIRWAGLKKGNG